MPRKAPLTPDEQVHEGFFARAIDGPYAGRYGVIQRCEDHTAVLRTRDDRDELLNVEYDHLRPDTAGRR